MWSIILETISAVKNKETITLNHCVGVNIFVSGSPTQRQILVENTNQSVRVTRIIYMDVSSDSQINFIIDEYDDIFTNDAHQGMSEADYDTTLGPPKDGHFPPASNAADAPTASGSHVPTSGAHTTTSGGHVTSVSDAAAMISATTSVNCGAPG